jgi:hypothetical protein
VGGLWLAPDQVAQQRAKTKAVERNERNDIQRSSKDPSESNQPAGAENANNVNNTPVLPYKNLQGQITATNPNPSGKTPAYAKHPDIRSDSALNGLVNDTPLLSRMIYKESIIPLPAISPSVNNSSQEEKSRDSLIHATAKMLALAPGNPGTDIHLHVVKETAHESRKTSAKNRALSFYGGSYFNYSLGSETKLNFGGGFTSDIRLSGNLRLSTGIGLANNSLTYNDGVPSSNKQKLAFDAVPSFGLATNLGTNNLTTVTKYDANLLALDIPVNIKYLIIPEDNKFYLLAGLSSGTYLAEKYSLIYRNYNVNGVYINQPANVEEKRQLRTFDLARTLNISIGYSTNFGKSQNITIEPFLKYPLSGLGSEDLKFGATGVNLKMNFSQFKK